MLDPVLPLGISDSGTTGHYIPLTSENEIMNVKPSSNPLIVRCANKSTMNSSKTGELDLPLPPGALDCHLFKDLAEPLMSISKFCDNGLKAVFDAKKIDLIDINGNVVLTGNRDHRGMYMLPIKQSGAATSTSTNVPSDPALPLVNASIYSLNSNARTIAQRVAFLSKTFGNPADG